MPGEHALNSNLKNSVKIYAKLGKMLYLDTWIPNQKYFFVFAKIMKKLNTRNHDLVNLNNPQTLLLAVSLGVAFGVLSSNIFKN